MNGLLTNHEVPHASSAVVLVLAAVRVLLEDRRSSRGMDRYGEEPQVHDPEDHEKGDAHSHEGGVQEGPLHLLSHLPPPVLLRSQAVQGLAL